MAFVTEFIPEDDLIKYCIAEINDKVRKANFESEWTIDREKDVYLRWMRTERGDVGKNDLMFSWKGTVFWVALCRSGNTERGEKGWTRWTIWSYGGNSNLHVPEELKPHYDEVVKDFKDALTAYKDKGAFSQFSDHTASFDF